MLATRKRTRPTRKVCLPRLEELEDRRVFNASWQAHLPLPPAVWTETIVITVTEVQIPADSSAGAQHGADRDGPGGKHDGAYETEWTFFIEWFQGAGVPTGGQSGDTGGGSGNNGGTVTGGGPTSGNTGNSGGSTVTGDSGSGTSTSSGSSSTTSDPNPGKLSTSESSSAGNSQAAAATPASSPAENGNSTKPHSVSSTSSVAPAASTPTASAALAAAAVEPTPAAVETVAARPVAVRHELVARADLRPEAVAAVLNQAASNTVRIDYLPGGTEQPAVMPRAENAGTVGDSLLAPQQNTVIPAAPATAAVKAAPAAPGAPDKAADTGAEPQEAGLLTSGPAPAVPPLGLDNALRRLKGLLADLATSRALLHALPVTGALVVLGGAAFGVVRWRRQKQLAKKDVPDDIADDKDTWLPGSGSLPPVDRL